MLFDPDSRGIWGSIYPTGSSITLQQCILFHFRQYMSCRVLCVFLEPITSHSKIDNWSTETLTDIVFAYKLSYCCVVVRCPLWETGDLGLQAPPEGIIPVAIPNTAPFPARLWPCDKPPPTPPLSPQPFWFTAKTYFIAVSFGISLIDYPQPEKGKGQACVHFRK